MASDSVRIAEAELFTDVIRQEVQQIANPRKTHHLPGICLFVIGMRLLLFSKKCVRLGLMNGCVCRLEDIIFSSREDLSMSCRSGEACVLRYMPVALLLRAEGVSWTLPNEQLPPLPDGFDRRGLFLLKSHTNYFSYNKLHVKRVTFPVYDASTRIVYSAQGEQWKAVVADVSQPHDMDDAIFWLASYVMMSRAESLEGLLLTRLCPKGSLERGPPAYLIDEVNRLLELERYSQAALKAYLSRYCSPLPSVILQLFMGDDMVPNYICEEVLSINN